MSSFVGSPVWGAVITIVGTMALGIITMMARLISKVNTIDSKVNAIAEDVTEIKADQDVVRWSEIARRRRKKGRDVI